ncbi:hypothetical protein [Aurantiacibacter gangjinensis]|uniref:Uncharacterized protein n=1 Tax=Aurantiacibacter gangjinensis TaxID=502682 RepID=A0A0G9MKW7_9SPHN|nr:hypothetical protein [Aurantiacibacter gangjinensis]APE27192.1 hypothetical protein BMF35_a0363 [Aurantiacibacter gangjinensis]KLE31327.1 hypothetical protein AAW01_06835 [Aurantiacibacter gangjinensis]
MAAFALVEDRLVAADGKFAIWQSVGPEYSVRVIIGYADGRPLYRFHLLTREVAGEWQAVLSPGRRDHVFDSALLGKMPELVKAAIPAMIGLPNFGLVDDVAILLAPANIVEMTVTDPRFHEAEDLIVMARRL